MTILKKQRLKEKELRILILGLDNGGKTTVLKKLNGEEIDEIAPTLVKLLIYLVHVFECFFMEGVRVKESKTITGSGFKLLV